ncbi:MAG: hypothetical protein EXS10_02820 [Phycisphaerales bacterium]|nr:hypothetical protein [Phycisphaerales bacterium]
MQSPRILAALLALSTVACAFAQTASEVNRKAFPSTLSAPKVYVIPMHGQMGTDIHPQPYKLIIADAKKAKPDLIIIELKSADIDNNFYLKNDDQKEAGQVHMEEYRDLVKSLREELRDVPQVMWIQDSVGFGSLMAFAWPDMYMTSDARLWGLQNVAKLAGGWSDPDVAAKMLAAWTGIGKGFLQQGGYPLELGDAMLLPEKTLSVKFEGRDSVWLPNTSGVWTVDSSKEATVNFNATTAEDTGLADGVADSLDDLMFLLGYREFENVESGRAIFTDYTEGWRKAYDRCVEWLESAQSVDEGIKGFGQRKSLFEKVISAMKQYPAVERRLQREMGVTRLQLEIEVGNIKKEIARSKNTGDNNGGGGGGNSRGLGGGGMGGKR